jgi:hypothetical protein
LREPLRPNDAAQAQHDLRARRLWRTFLLACCSRKVQSSKSFRDSSQIRYVFVNPTGVACAHRTNVTGRVVPVCTTSRDEGPIQTGSDAAERSSLLTKRAEGISRRTSNESWQQDECLHVAPRALHGDLDLPRIPHPRARERCNLRHNRRIQSPSCRVDLMR